VTLHNLDACLHKIAYLYTRQHNLDADLYSNDSDPHNLCADLFSNDPDPHNLDPNPHPADSAPTCANGPPILSAIVGKELVMMFCRAPFYSQEFLVAIYIASHEIVDKHKRDL